MLLALLVFGSVTSQVSESDFDSKLMELRTIHSPIFFDYDDMDKQAYLYSEI